MKRGRSLPFVFLGPPLIILMVLALVPTLFAINISFQNRTLSQGMVQYVWFENYVALFSDPRFLNALWVSLKWELLTVALTMLVGVSLGIAMFEAASTRMRTILCILFIIPVLLPRVCAAFVWKFAFHPLYGALTWPVRELTGATPDVLSTPWGALLTVTFVDVWQWGLFFAVIVLKLLEALPPQPIEAARIDKATRWDIHRYITIPMLKVPLISLLLVKAIESLRSFDLVYVMTRGGPGISTETLDMYAYSQGFIESGKISYASSMAVIMMVLTIVVFTVAWKRLNR
ncbi:sugar ABC transporter permease [Brucella sp. NM4]|uniref:Sugar ABC transporter permease n=1 Tax=Ochrobactrum soli TaxID=2448455 RepID=A0A849KVZ8_9HYPH|nr:MULTISPECIES: sugar ABC transporter permease [Brucella]NNU63169.1 sugar ABC transporter permease [[Ochrobactrum] soli]WHS30003.1 sugar ABC transporter permease [Brucella sp. NM4]WHT44510.1 sugar ABC transporter permease [Ochrobactrum sp. SSR]